MTTTTEPRLATPAQANPETLEDAALLVANGIEKAFVANKDWDEQMMVHWAMLMLHARGWGEQVEYFAEPGEEYNGAILAWEQTELMRRLGEMR